jgi:hypothetical protein
VHGSAGGGTLKGETPGTGPARNKAGRCRAEKGPESVRNAARARTWRLVASGASGCPIPGRRRRGRNRKGGVVDRGNPADDGAGAIRLWRGAKGYERMARGKRFPRAGRRGEDLTGQPQGQDHRGRGKPITTLAPSIQYSASLVNPRRVGWSLVTGIPRCTGQLKPPKRLLLETDSERKTRKILKRHFVHKGIRKVEWTT